MERLIALPMSPKLLTILIASTALTACAMGPREGPPAPIVQVTPRPTEPVAPPEPPEERVEESLPAPLPPKKPAKPAKPPTKVFAYRDPNAPPEPVTPSAPEPSAAPSGPSQTAPAPGSPAAITPGQAASTPRQPTGVANAPSPQQPPSTPGQAPQPGTQGAQQVAKAEPQRSTPSQPTAEPPTRLAPPAAPATPLPPSNVAAPNLPPAAGTLATQAEQQRQAGDYAGAAATLERSLRIAPREAYLWNRLARVRMEQGQSAQAGNLAARSNDLAGDKGDVKKDNWRIIAESKRRAGDVAGAGEAEQRAGAD